MNQPCYPCLFSDMIPVREVEICEWQDNEYARYLKRVSEEFINKMHIPFGTYSKTHFFVKPCYNRRVVLQFISSIYSDAQAVVILQKRIKFFDSIGSHPYEIIKSINGQEQVIFSKPYVKTEPLTKRQKQFILDNEGKLEPHQIVKILNLSKWKVYGFRKRHGLVKSPVYHGNRKKQNILH